MTADPRAPHSTASSTVGRGGVLPEIVRALLRPEAYPHPADGLTLHETHISWVILAGPYAYKLKKPVNFGFLDFSTLDRRAADCVDEVRLNRRLAPDVYLGVVQVVERDGTFFVSGPGRPVEPAVWMRRLPAEGMLPRLLARGEADAGLVRRIARKLARFHARAATGPGVNEYGSAAAIRANWQENFAQTELFTAQMLPPWEREAIIAYVQRFLDEQGRLLERRVAAGRVRDGHGDLHAASICVENGRIHFFDCLEFSPRLRCADVAAEVAFLAMDFDHRGRADLAEAFVDAYVRHSGDDEIRDLLDFYRCYRAYVRGKVLGLRLAQPGLPANDAERIAAEARAYFDLAWAYAGGLARPALIIAMGPPASGKTALAEALAGRLGLVHLSSDVTRKQLVGVPPTEHHPEAFEQGLYRPEMTRRTYAVLRRRAARLLRRGRSVVLDATYGQAVERAAVRRLASRLRVPLVVLVCRADETVLRARLAARADGTETASDARLELWPALMAAFSEPVDLPEAVSVDTTAPLDVTVEQAVAVLRDRLAQPHTQSRISGGSSR
jgi:aminoglycoside phosphotransferase family enzyme/predicted kinase